MMEIICFKHQSVVMDFENPEILMSVFELLVWEIRNEVCYELFTFAANFLARSIRVETVHIIANMTKDLQVDEV